MPEVTSDIRLYVREAITEATKDLMAAQESLTAPLEGRLRIMEDWHNQEIGSRQRDSRLRNLVLAAVALLQIITLGRELLK